MLNGGIRLCECLPSVSLKMGTSGSTRHGNHKVTVPYTIVACPQYIVVEIARTVNGRALSPGAFNPDVSHPPIKSGSQRPPAKRRATPGRRTRTSPPPLKEKGCKIERESGSGGARLIWEASEKQKLVLIVHDNHLCVGIQSCLPYCEWAVCRDVYDVDWAGTHWVHMAYGGGGIGVVVGEQASWKLSFSGCVPSPNIAIQTIFRLWAPSGTVAPLASMWDIDGKLVVGEYDEGGDDGDLSDILGVV